MSVANDNKQLLLDCAPKVLDPILAPLGFKRGERSLMYSRTFPATKHEFHLSFQSSPSYAPKATMHLLPTVLIRMPSIGETALQLVGDPLLLANAPDVIVAHQIQNLIPKSTGRHWYISGPDSARVALEEVSGCFTRWIEPFLQDYSSPGGLIRQYEAGDKRPLQQRHFFIFIAAAYVERGQRDRAAQVLDSHLGKPGLRKKYATAFASVA
jgi:hypothetical protein